jgi:predicted anti-sigma-YlaC factor YlaD
MTPSTSVHLTDEQFAECAMSAPSAASRAHLADCSHCRQQLSNFQSSITDFSAATLGWSESLPAASLRPMLHAQRRKPMFAAAGWAVATALILSVAVPAIWHHDHPQSAPSETAQQEDSDAQIAQDNQLLQSVNVAIGVDDSSPIKEYGLQAPRSGTKAQPELRSE